MIILKGFQLRKSLIYAVFLPWPARVRSSALGDVILDNGIHDVVFGNAVSDALKDDLDSTVQGSQVGFPQDRGHGVFAHGITHRFTQLPRAVVEPVVSKSSG